MLRKPFWAHSKDQAVAFLNVKQQLQYVVATTGVRWRIWRDGGEEVQATGCAIGLCHNLAAPTPSRRHWWGAAFRIKSNQFERCSSLNDGIRRNISGSKQKQRVGADPQASKTSNRPKGDLKSRRYPQVAFVQNEMTERLVVSVLATWKLAYCDGVTWGFTAPPPQFQAYQTSQLYRKLSLFELHDTVHLSDWKQRWLKMTIQSCCHPRPARAPGRAQYW